MDMVKALGSDDLADIRVKSQIQRIEQESAKILGEYKKAKPVTRNISKSAKRIIGTGEDADARTNRFIEMCRYVQSKVDTSLVQTGQTSTPSVSSLASEILCSTVISLIMLILS